MVQEWLNFLTGALKSPPHLFNLYIRQQPWQRSHSIIENPQFLKFPKPWVRKHNFGPKIGVAMANSQRNLAKPMVKETAIPTSFNGTGHSFTNEGGDGHNFSGTNINSGARSIDGSGSSNGITVVNLKCCVLKDLIYLQIKFKGCF